MAIHRAVINTSEAGVVYDFMRDGRQFRSLDILKLEPNGQNAVHAYRVDRADGPFLPMTPPAFLTVYVRAPEATAFEIVATVEAGELIDGDHFAFPIPTDFAQYQNREVQLGFKDSTTGAITAKPSALTLTASRQAAGYSLQAGTWAVVSAVVTDLSDKRVRFRSSDPSVALVIESAAAAAYNLGSARPAQGTEYCVVVAAGAGSAAIECLALGNQSAVPLTDTVAVTVEAAATEPSGEDYAAQIKKELSGILFTYDHAIYCPQLPGTVFGDIREGRWGNMLLKYYTSVNDPLVPWLELSRSCPGKDGRAYLITFRIRGFMAEAKPQVYKWGNGYYLVACPVLVAMMEVGTRLQRYILNRATTAVQQPGDGNLSAAVQVKAFDFTLTVPVMGADPVAFRLGLGGLEPMHPGVSSSEGGANDAGAYAPGLGEVWDPFGYSWWNSPTRSRYAYGGGLETNPSVFQSPTPAPPYAGVADDDSNFPLRVVQPVAHPWLQIDCVAVEYA